MVEFTPYEINLCLYDKERTKRFQRAIKRIVNADSVVIDTGAGTGILALFAAKAGAKKVYALEINKRFVQVAKENVRRNGFEKVIKVIHCDAKKFKPPEKVDVVICELLATGLFFEPEIQMMNHLRRFLKKGGRLIPRKSESWIQLIDAQNALYGIRLDYDSRSLDLINDKILTDKQRFDILEFEKKREPVKLNVTVILTGKRKGLADAVRITSRAELAKGVFTIQTEFLFNPEIIHLPKPIHVEKGEKYSVNIKFPGGADSLDAKFTIRKLK